MELAAADIDVIVTHKQSPVYLSTRFGEWISGRMEKGDEFISDLLDQKYGSGTEPDKSLEFGDPRNFLGHTEQSHIAYMRGEIGILSDIELAYSECDPTAFENPQYKPGDNGFNADGDIPLLADEFQKKVRYYQVKLAELSPKYPLSKLFLMHGLPTFNGRISLCAFTPLKQGPDMQFSSPYGDAAPIVSLDAEINAID